MANPSYPYDAALHPAGSAAAAGGCSVHATGDAGCTDDAVVSFQDGDGAWQAGCARALEELVERDEIEPLGQGA